MTSAFINRLVTGVPGLDTILGGGLPEFSFNLITGAPGSGKTTLAHQIMFNLATPDRPALFFTVLGEPPIKMLRYQQQFSFFDVEKINKSVHFLNLSTEMNSGDFDQVLARVVKEVNDRSAGLVFVDSFRSVSSISHRKSEGESQLQQFIQSLGSFLTGWQATTFLVGEYEGTDSGANPIFTVADGIFMLNQAVEQNSTVRKIRVWKMRGQAVVNGLHSFRISNSGIEVFPRLLSQPRPEDPARQTVGPIRGRLSMGSPELDAMMGGGLPMGHSMLVSGPSGSGKSTLAAMFLAAGARAGEKGLLATFERNSSQASHAEINRLVADRSISVIETPGLDVSLDETLHELTLAIAADGATRVVIDSLSGLELALDPHFRLDFREAVYRIVAGLTAAGASVIITTEADQHCTHPPTAPHTTSFLTDSMIMQRHVEVDGRLERQLAVVKMRNSAHSGAVRAYRITDAGIEITPRS
ncbi:MAG: AAA family ATPase [Gemmatimonadales bacterium]|nr:AAA family ATPase [Gemmatimonadales bacterium]